MSESLYPTEIRRVIYTTNAIESLNRPLRKVIKTKAVFPDEASVFKLMYLAMNNISKKWKRPIKDWRSALSHFAILFPERFSLSVKKRLHKIQIALAIALFVRVH